MKFNLEATGTEKWVIVTDLLKAPPEEFPPRELELGTPEEWTVNARREETVGSVLIKVGRSRAGNYAIHASDFPVYPRYTYPIDDDNLP